jgi:predicted ATPase/DNA-binding SARP family transcriptional activator
MPDQPELLLWGVPELLGQGTVTFTSERRFQLLLVLALQSGRWVERDRIAALLWPEHALAEARRNLRKVLFNAHEVAGAGRVEASPTALRWSVRTDFEAFREDLRAGRGAQACERRRGAPLQAIDDGASASLGTWLAAERARMDQAWHAAALAHLHGLPEPNARLQAARRMLEVDPLDESAMAALLAADRALGRTAEAAADYRRYAVRLVEQLGVEPSQSLRSLLDASPAGAPLAARPAVPALRDEGAFIGRRHELAELGALLARPECRCITILGPGGTGKSSLARRALPGVAGAHPGGSLWVELQDLVNEAQLTDRLARALSLDIGDSQDPVAAIALRVGGLATLLVLDNAEHLDGLPALLDRLLTAAPALRLLVTSRARLHGHFEWVLPLAGLAVPDEDSRDADAAIHFDAVRLFDARASTAQRGFRLESHLQPVIEIVEAVAGMPLAIELAASWVRLLPPTEIARELRLSLDLLERDPASRAQPARPEHVSMTAVLERAWQLLAPQERQALLALSVFRGGFTRVAAQRVAGVPLPLLSALVDKSLLTVDETGRFSMHPLVAAYAAAGLQADAPREEAVRTAHAEYFAQHLGALQAHAYGDQRLLSAGVASEAANGQAAWQPC